jgi:hypothetical protein
VIWGDFDPTEKLLRARAACRLGATSAVVLVFHLVTHPQQVQTNRQYELTPIWIPDAAHEAMRDLVRARATALLVKLPLRVSFARKNALKHGRFTDLED